MTASIALIGAIALTTTTVHLDKPVRSAGAKRRARSQSEPGCRP